MGESVEICGVCGQCGIYNHDDDEVGNMTLLSHGFDYIHWICYDKAIETRDKIGG